MIQAAGEQAPDEEHDTDLDDRQLDNQTQLISDLQQQVAALLAGARERDAQLAALHWWRGKLWGLVPLVGLTPFGRLGGDLLPTTAVGMDDCVYFHEAGRPRPSVIALPHVDELRTG